MMLITQYDINIIRFIDVSKNIENIDEIFILPIYYTRDFFLLDV